MSKIVKSMVFASLLLSFLMWAGSISAYSSNVSVSAYFVNPKDRAYLSEAPTGTVHTSTQNSDNNGNTDNTTANQQNTTTENNSQSTNTSPSNNAQANTQGNSSGVPAFYVYSPKIDTAFGFIRDKMTVYDTGASFVISTMLDYGKYEVIPVVKENKRQALAAVNLKEFKFTNDSELIQAVIPWLKTKVYKKDLSFGQPESKNGAVLLPFDYKDLDYEKMWQDYATKSKNIKKTDYYVTKKGILYIKVKDMNAVAVVIYDIEDKDKEITNAESLIRNTYIHPSFVRAQAVQIQGTDISFTYDPREWLVNFDKKTIYMSFYHSAYEKKPEYASLYSSTGTIMFFPRQASKEVTAQFVKEEVLASALLDFERQYPNKSKAELEKEAKAFVQEIKKDGIFVYCYTSKPVLKEWGGFKPTTNDKPQEIKKVCSMGKDKTFLTVRMSYIKDSEGEKKVNGLFSSITIDSNVTEATNSQSSYIFDGKLRLIPVVSASSTEVEQLKVEDVLAPLGTVKIFNKSCTNLRIPATNYTTELRLANKVYPICIPSTGSGFAVNNNYIVSNAHVMYPAPISNVGSFVSLAVKYLQSGQFLVKAIDGGLTNDLVVLSKATLDYLRSQGANVTSDTTSIVRLALVLLKDIVGHVDLKDMTRLKDENWVAIGKNGGFTIDKDQIILLNSAQLQKATVVKGYDITGVMLKASYGDKAPFNAKIEPDLALAKVDTSMHVVPVPINKESTSISIGSKITAVGYPGAIEMSGLLAKKSTYPTVVKGTISGIKDIEGGNFKIIQFSGAIGHGNSGGPIVDSESNVLGVVTYSFTSGLANETADLGGAVEIGEVVKLLDSNGVKYNESALTEKVKTAVTEYNKYHFKNAKKLFEEIKSENPTYFAFVMDPLINKCQTYIDQGLDKSGLFGMLGDYANYILAGLGVIALGILGFVVYKFVIKKTKTGAPQPPHTSQVNSKDSSGNNKVGANQGQALSNGASTSNTGVSSSHTNSGGGGLSTTNNGMEMLPGTSNDLSSSGLGVGNSTGGSANNQTHVVNSMSTTATNTASNTQITAPQSPAINNVSGQTNTGANTLPQSSGEVINNQAMRQVPTNTNNSTNSSLATAENPVQQVNVFATENNIVAPSGSVASASSSNMNTGLISGSQSSTATVQQSTATAAQSQGTIIPQNTGAVVSNNTSASTNNTQLNPETPQAGASF